MEMPRQTDQLVHRRFIVSCPKGFCSLRFQCIRVNPRRSSRGDSMRQRWYRWWLWSCCGLPLDVRLVPSKGRFCNLQALPVSIWELFSFAVVGKGAPVSRYSYTRKALKENIECKMTLMVQWQRLMCVVSGFNADQSYTPKQCIHHEMQFYVIVYYKLCVHSSTCSLFGRHE